MIDLAENAVDQNNEATRIIVNFGTRRSREKSAGCVLYRCESERWQSEFDCDRYMGFRASGGMQSDSA